MGWRKFVVVPSSLKFVKSFASFTTSDLNTMNRKQSKAVEQRKCGKNSHENAIGTCITAIISVSVDVQDFFSAYGQHSTQNALLQACSQHNCVVFFIHDVFLKFSTRFKELLDDKLKFSMELFHFDHRVLNKIEGGWSWTRKCWDKIRVKTKFSEVLWKILIFSLSMIREIFKLEASPIIHWPIHFEDPKKYAPLEVFVSTGPLLDENKNWEKLSERLSSVLFWRA